MTIVKRSSKNQVAIPQELIRRAGLSKDDVWFAIEYRQGAFWLKPVEFEEKIPVEQIETFERKTRQAEKGDVLLGSEKAFHRFLAKRKRLLK